MKEHDNSFVSALTIDVEDGINIAMRDHFNVSMEPTGRVLSNMQTILGIFEKNDVKATFFILGEVAKKFPGLVRKIDAMGHEIGIHGYHHDQIFKLKPEEFKEGLVRTKKIIENTIGKPVYGFRAPAFSINPDTAWSLPVIAECGFIYDSSIFPSKSMRYGWKGFSKNICELELGSSKKLVEVPLSVIRILGKEIPYGGGGYLRYFPYKWTRMAIRKTIKNRSAIIYLHPYELDKEKYPKYFYDALSKSILKKRLVLKFYRYKKHTVEYKLDRVTQEFNCVPIIDIIKGLKKKGSLPNYKLHQL